GGPGPFCYPLPHAGHIHFVFFSCSHFGFFSFFSRTGSLLLLHPAPRPFCPDRLLWWRRLCGFFLPKTHSDSYFFVFGCRTCGAGNENGHGYAFTGRIRLHPCRLPPRPKTSTSSWRPSWTPFLKKLPGSGKEA